MARADQRLLKLLGEASKRTSLVALLRELVKAGEGAEAVAEPKPRPAPRTPARAAKPAPRPRARTAARR